MMTMSASCRKGRWLKVMEYQCRQSRRPLQGTSFFTRRSHLHNSMIRQQTCEILIPSVGLSDQFRARSSSVAGTPQNGGKESDNGISHCRGCTTPGAMPTLGKGAPGAAPRPEMKPRSVLRERRPFSKHRKLQPRQSSVAGTIQSVCTCDAFILSEVVKHYLDCGLVLKDFTDVVWVHIPAVYFRDRPLPENSPILEMPSREARCWPCTEGDVEAPPEGKREVRLEGHDLVSASEDEDDLEKADFEVFFFSYGVVVWWSPFSARKTWLLGGRHLLSEIEANKNTFERLSKPMLELENCMWSVMEEDEEWGESLFRSALFHSRIALERIRQIGCKIDCDHFYLTSKSVEKMLALSYGLAQSAKLTEFEERVDHVIEDTKTYPNMLLVDPQSERERLLSHQELVKMRGKLFLHRMDINLHTDMLETPDFFWNRSELVRVYQEARKYMEITSRTSVLNKRLEVVHELFSVMYDELQTRTSNMLEWIIIWLLFSDLLIGLAMMYFDVGE
eukprot:Sspe_Gene.82886::Locus_54346_Transcript_6_7_Confidence_0.143_Length_2854::g.82886::m.82886